MKLMLRPVARWLIGVWMLVSLSLVVVALSREVPYELENRETGGKIEGRKLLEMVASLGDGGDVYASFFNIDAGEMVSTTMLYRGHRLNVDVGIYAWRGYMYSMEPVSTVGLKNPASGELGWNGPYQRTGNITTLIGSNEAAVSAECRAAAHELTDKIHAKLVGDAKVTYRRQYVVYHERAYVWCYGMWEKVRESARRG